MKSNVTLVSNCIVFNDPPEGYSVYLFVVFLFCSWTQPKLSREKKKGEKEDAVGNLLVLVSQHSGEDFWELGHQHYF